MDRCPKCHTDNAVYYEDVLGEKLNKCVSCAWSHTPNSCMQSFERQVTGKNLRFGIGDAKAQFKGEQE